jgi:hypothetical protein
LNVIGSKVHANGFTAPADTHGVFWAAYGSVYAPDNVTTGLTWEVVVDSPDVSPFEITFGSESDLPGGDGQPTYNVALDFNLDGFLDSLDSWQFEHVNFGLDWVLDVPTTSA